MVPRMARPSSACAESFRFPADTRQGVLPFLTKPDEQNTKPHDLQERNAAKGLFLTADNLPTALANTLSSTVSSSSGTVVTTEEPKQAQPALKGRLMSKEDAERVKAAIAKASSIDEIRRLELSLREGYMPELEGVGA